MSLKWTDIEEIAELLEEAHPEVDLMSLRFTDLWGWVQQLPDFSDDPARSNERILEAIQAAWIIERNLKVTPLS
ncbi:MAG: Fe-S cluster assembly protein IscX [Alphaproteobacteria bacterium]